MSSAAQTQAELVREAFGRCSPSACWSVWGDLARGGITDRKAWDYPIGHLQRLAAELSVIFGQQAPDRLREVGVDDARIERLKKALSCAAIPEGYDVPRLLDAYEAFRAELWRIAFRAETAQREGDSERALAEIEAWAMEVLHG